MQIHRSVWGNPTIGFHVIGPKQAEIGIESMGRGQKGGEMAKMPFSDAGGGVILCLERPGDGVSLGWQSAGGSAKNNPAFLVASHPAANGQSAGQLAGAARSADACGN